VGGVQILRRMLVKLERARSVGIRDSFCAKNSQNHFLLFTYSSAHKCYTSVILEYLRKAIFKCYTSAGSVDIYKCYSCVGRLSARPSLA